MNLKKDKFDVKCKESFNWLIHLHYIREEYDLIDRLIDKINIKSEYFLYLKGLIALRKDGDVKQALSFFNQIKSFNNPNYIKATIRCFMLLGDHDHVCDLIKETGLRLAPNDWQLWNMLGNSYFHLGNISLAKDAYQHSIQTSNQIEPFLSLSDCYLIDGDIKSAISIFRNAEKIASENIALKIKLSLILIANDMKSKGVEKILQLSSISSNTAKELSVSLAVGTILQEIKNDIDGALLRYKLSDCLDSPGIWNNIGLCFMAKKKYVAAVSCLKRAAYLNVLDHRIIYNLGLLNFHLKQFASAFHFFKASVSLQKASSSLPFSLLAVCLEQFDDKINAEKAHSTAIKSNLNQLNPISLLNYAIYLTNLNQDQYKELITELMIQFEQNWLKQKHLKNEYDESVIKTVNQISLIFNLSCHMACTKNDESFKNQQSYTDQRDLKEEST